MKSITKDVTDILKFYVYVYIDPRDGKPFYIGKGQGNRMYAHLEDRSESEKVARIMELRAAGCKPRIDILRYGLSDAEAKLVEAAAIDLIGKPHLTNKISGFHSKGFGRISSEELIGILSAKPVAVAHKAILITINRLYRGNMTAQELYEATRGIWVVGERREKAEFAMAVFQGVVREVYRIRTWYPSGTLEYKTRDSSDFSDRNRWEFEGDIALDVRAEYVGLSVGTGSQNPIRYRNV